MKKIPVLVYAAVLIGISYLLDSVIQHTSRPSNTAYTAIWILLSCPVFAYFTYRHRQALIGNVALIIIIASVLNLILALAITVSLGGWGSLTGYLTTYALPTLISMLPTWIIAAILGILIGSLVRTLQKYL